MIVIGKAILNVGTPEEVWGICESQDLAFEPNNKEIENHEGDTVSVILTNTGKKKFTGVFTPYAGVENSPASDAELIGKAMDFKINDGQTTIKIYILNAALKRKKGDASEFSIDGYYYPKIAEAAAPAGGGA